MDKLSVLLNAKEKWDYAEPKPGAQIRVDRGTYFHHGIYIGNAQVIAFGEGDASRDIGQPSENKIEEISLAGFLRGGLVQVRSYSLAEKLLLNKSAKTIETARSLLGTGGYDIMKNNCEHFSNYCAFGVKYSESDRIKL